MCECDARTFYKFWIIAIVSVTWIACRNTIKIILKLFPFLYAGLLCHECRCHFHSMCYSFTIFIYVHINDGCIQNWTSVNSIYWQYYGDGYNFNPFQIEWKLKNKPMATDFIFSNLRIETIHDWFEFDVFYWTAMKPIQIKFNWICLMNPYIYMNIWAEGILLFIKNKW